MASLPQTTTRQQDKRLAKTIATWTLGLGLGVCSFVFVVILTFRCETGVFISALVLFVVTAISSIPFVPLAGELIGWFACRYSDNRRIRIIFLSLAAALIMDVAFAGWMIVLIQHVQPDRTS